MKNVAIDLYNHCNEWVVKFIKEKYNVVAIYSAPYFLNYCACEHKIILDTECSTFYDTVIVLNDELVVVDIVKNRIKKHIENKKNIICCYLGFSTEDREYLLGKSEEKGIELTFCDEFSSKESHPIKQIEIPIIFVCGMGVNCDKTCTALNLKESFSRKNKKSLIISINEYDNLFDGISLKELLLESSTLEIINKVNSIIRDKTYEGGYDALIVVVPFGLLAYDDTITNHFGIINYIFTQALHPDFCMFNLYFKKYSLQQVSKIKKMINRVIGDIPTVMGLSHIYFDTYNYDMDKNNINYIVVDKESYNRFVTDMSKEEVFFYDTRDSYSIDWVIDNVR